MEGNQAWLRGVEPARSEEGNQAWLLSGRSCELHRATPAYARFNVPLY